jgi:hypothetical protein
VLVLVQRPAQTVVPDKHAQCPLRHDVPPVQVAPQAPQLRESANRSTHAPTHAVKPAPQDVAQVPELQTEAAHTWPHVPQLSGADRKSTQRPTQTDSFVEQAVGASPDPSTSFTCSAAPSAVPSSLMVAPS